MMRISKNTIAVLKFVAMLGAVGTALVIPNAAIGVKAFLDAEKNIQRRAKLKKHLMRLDSEGVIILSGDVVTLTKKGKELLGFVQLDQLHVEISEWDKIWRVVTYDVPITSNKYRDAFRKAIEGIGFIQIQKSVFIFPYECKEEVAIAAQICHVAQYVLYMHAQDVPNATKLMKRFHLDDS